MKFLADENFPKPLVAKLRNLGYSIYTVQQKNLPGILDETVANFANKDQRIILTFDRNFLKDEREKVKLVIFYFPKIHFKEILLFIEEFVSGLQNYSSVKYFVLQFDKYGLKKID